MENDEQVNTTTQRNYLMLKTVQRLTKPTAKQIEEATSKKEITENWPDLASFKKGINNLATKGLIFTKKTGRGVVYALTEIGKEMVENGDNGIIRPYRGNFNPTVKSNYQRKSRTQKSKANPVEARVNASATAQELISQVGDIVNSNATLRDALEQINMITKNALNSDEAIEKPKAPPKGTDPLTESINALNYENNSLKYQLFTIAKTTKS